MKNLNKIILILLITNLGFSQNSKTIHDKDGLSVTYNLSIIGNSTNPETGTTFDKYKLALTINNSSSKYWAFNAGNSISTKWVKGGILNTSDSRFVSNGGQSTIDHFCIEDNCSDFPRYSSVAAPHQVICPSSSQECEKTFLYPTNLAGSPELYWTGWGFIEMIEDGTVRNNKVKQTIQTNISNNKTLFDNLEAKYYTLKQESRNSGIWAYGKAIYDICLEKNCEQILKTKDIPQLNQIVSYFEIIKKKYTQNTKPSSCSSAN